MKTLHHGAKVARWAPCIDRVLELHRLGQEPGLGLTIISLVHVESAGDPMARRAGSQFCGLLQMGRAAGIDAGCEDRGADTTAHLLGAPMWAIDTFIVYLERYWSRHNGGPEQIAVLWKGGPGTLALWRSLPDPEHAPQFANGWRKAVPEYVRRFRIAQEMYR